MKMKLQQLFCLLLLVLWSVPIRAQVIEDKMRDNTLTFYAEYIRKPPAGCTDPVTDLQRKACAAYALKQADSVMQTAFQKAYTFLNKAGQRKQADLVLQQKLWIDHRNGHCDLVSQSAEGSPRYHVIIMGCMTELTNKRTAELKMIVE